MKEHDNCPKCGVSFIGELIPEESREFFGGSTNFRREIGIDGGRAGIYDGIVAWRCPDCDHEWARAGKWGEEMFDKYLKVCAGEDINEAK